MNELQELAQALASLGLAWAEVWRMTADRQAGTLAVVTSDGRKLITSLAAGEAPANRKRVKLIKRTAGGER